MRKREENKGKESTFDDLIRDAVKVVDEVVSIHGEGEEKRAEKSDIPPGKEDPPDLLTIDLDKRPLKEKKKKKPARRPSKGLLKETREKLKTLERKYSLLEEEKEKVKERLIWVSADFENFRKRAQREAENLKKYALTDFIKSLLPVVDNLELALKFSKGTSRKSTFGEGVRMLHKQFLQILESYSVTKIPVEVGTPFDPSIHEALLLKETRKYPPGVVTDIKKDGYFIHDRLLRAVLVEVSKEKASLKKRKGTGRRSGGKKKGKR